MTWLLYEFATVTGFLGSRVPMVTDVMVKDGQVISASSNAVEGNSHRMESNRNGFRCLDLLRRVQNALKHT